MQIQEILRYSDYTMELLRVTLASHPEAWETAFETIADHGTVRALVVHISGAEDRWMQRVQGATTLGARYETLAPADMAAVFNNWQRIRAATRAVISGLDAAGLSRAIPLSIPGVAPQKTVEQILFQVFNHQTYHLGQISMTLQRMNIDPPNFDFVLLPDEHD